MDGNELVAHLRSQELDSLESEIRAGRRDHILKTLDERGRAQELVRQQYTGRYPFELLQNANDAAGDRNASGGRVRFVLTASALIVADEGGGFGESQIRAICGLGRSSKDPRKSIGYKGLGFKSVGEITDRPQIVSDKAQFCFNEELARQVVVTKAGDLPPHQRLPVYAFPFPLGRAEIGDDDRTVDALREKGFHTLLRLPFKKGVERRMVEGHLLAAITPRLLLFLDATEQLEVVGTVADFSAIAVRERADSYSRVLLEANGHDEDWLIFERRFDVPSREMVAKLGDAWREVEEVKAAVGIPLDDQGRPSGRGAEPFHVYFPTHEQSGFPYIIHADFALELDRRHIATNPEAIEYNDWLTSEAAQLVSEIVVPELASAFAGSASVVAVLAPLTDPGGFGAKFRAQCFEALRKCRFVPCVDGKPRMPAEVRLLPRSIPDPLAAHHFVDQQRASHLVLPEIERHAPSRKLLREYLDAAELDVPQFLQSLRLPASQDAERFYDFLALWSERVGQQALAKLLAVVPCVRTTDGRWLAPEQGIFFPRQRGDISFPEDLPIPIAAVPESVESLLADAGVRRFEWRSLLPEFVLPYLTDERATPADRRRAFVALRAYHRTERSGDPRLRTLIDRVLVPVRIGQGALQGLRPAADTYFSKDWVGNDLLEIVYGPFGETEFLDLIPPIDDDDLTSEREFYEWLGVSALPRVHARVTDERDTLMIQFETHHPHRKMYPKAWEAWLAAPATVEAKECGQGHACSQQIRKSFVLDRLPELAASGDYGRLSALWRLLAHGWGSVFERAASAEFYCQASGHAGPRSRRPRSLMAFMLRDLEWVPSVQDSVKRLSKPRDVWRIAQGLPAHVARRVPVLDPKLDMPSSVPMATALGLVDAARPIAGDLSLLLKSMAEEYSALPDDSEDAAAISKAAGWAMRTLNEVLSAGQKLPDTEVPLVAKLDGRRVFHPKPYVANDRILADTWQDAVPVLEADRDLRSLHQALGLKRLEDIVAVRPVPRHPVPEVQASVEAKVVEAKPYLAAAAIEAVPSRRDDVIRGLARLEICVCQDLVLEYEFEGVTRHRTDAVSYIAVRQEQIGIVRRNIGTAHLELSADSGMPHWYPFGQQLAQFLGVPTQADAFALLLKATKAERQEYLAARLIGLDAVNEARLDLDQPPTDDSFDQVFAPYVEGGPTTGTPEETGTEVLVEAVQLPEGGGQPLTEKRPDEKLELPPINHHAVSISDAPPGAKLEGTTGPRQVWQGGTAASEPIDFEAQHRLQRAIGDRGEEAAFHAERARIHLAGGDPENVVWTSKDQPLAPYDITSVEPDGQRIYIEVKSTTSDDATDPFEISEGELLLGLQKRTSYYIYRVTKAHTDKPSVTRYQDPIGRVQQNQASLRLRSARLTFSEDSLDVSRLEP